MAHNSIMTIIYRIYSKRVEGDLEPILTDIGLDAGYIPGSLSSWPFTRINLKLICMSLDYGKKPEYVEKTQQNTETPHKGPSQTGIQTCVKL